jgi:hypothetical protein
MAAKKNRYGSADAMAGRAPKKTKPYSSEGVKGKRIKSSSPWAYDDGTGNTMSNYQTGPMKTSDALVKPRVSKVASSAKTAGGRALSSFYGGKGKGSADTQSARGAARRSTTYKMAGAEGPKRSAAKKPTRSSVSAKRK